MHGYGTLLVLLVIAMVITVAMVVITSLLGPKARNAYKDEPFECGNIPQPFEQRISVKFYVVALLFILFDLETVFLFPWATVFKDVGWIAFWSMISFVSILVLGLVYVWKRGALEWE